MYHVDFVEFLQTRVSSYVGTEFSVTLQYSRGNRLSVNGRTVVMGLKLAASPWQCDGL